MGCSCRACRAQRRLRKEDSWCLHGCRRKPLRGTGMGKSIISSLPKKEKNAVGPFIAVCLYSTDLFTKRKCTSPVFYLPAAQPRCLFAVQIQTFLDTTSTASSPTKTLVNCEKRKALQAHSHVIQLTQIKSANSFLHIKMSYYNNLKEAYPLMADMLPNG